tara:strand:- start:49242 stop:50039 length:798 start_codon:yes stop_codon:yes gene_type:complete
MSIKKVSTLHAVSALRPNNTLHNYTDYFQVSLSGEASGTSFSNQGYASTKLNYLSLTNNLSSSLEDARDLRYITLSGDPVYGSAEGSTRVNVGEGAIHRLTLATIGDGITLSGSKEGGNSTIYLSATDKYAIVPSKDGDYVSLACTEMPETRFEDIKKINLSDYKLLSNDDKENLIIEAEIDKEFIYVCEENTIDAISCVASDPAVVGAKVVDDKIVVSIDPVDEVPDFVVVKISGIRKGRLNRRFVKFTEEEAQRNNYFWGSWK